MSKGGITLYELIPPFIYTIIIINYLLLRHISTLPLIDY